jgi:hypothetical protein
MIDFSGITAKIDPPGFFRRLREQTTDLTDYFNGPIDASVLMFFRRRFMSGGEIGGERWAPLRPATIKLKRQSGRENMGILRHSNRLWASLTKRAGPDTVLSITPDRYERGTSDPKAIYHQKGFTMKTIFGRPFKYPRKLVARKLVPEEMPPEILSAWESLLVKHILRS